MLGIDEYREDEAMIEEVRRSQCPRMRVYEYHQVSVVLGRGSDPEAELHLKACRDDDVPLLRRRGGGCSVMLDPGNLIISAALPIAGLAKTKHYFNRCTEWLIDGLNQVGIDGVRSAGISDLAIGERKVAGSSLYRMKDLLYYSASLLVDARINLIERYLQHPPREPDYRRGRSHGKFLLSLGSAGWTGDTEELAIALNRKLNAAKLMQEP